MDRSTSDDDEGQGAWARPVSGRLAGLAAGSAFLACGVFFAAFSILDLQFGRIGLPGPGFFPFVLGIALCLLAVCILYYAWQERPDHIPPVYLGHRDVIITMIGLIGIAFAFEQMDSYIALGAFSAFLLVLIARTTWWRVVLGAVLGMLTVYLFFGIALGLRLPTGDYWTALLEIFTTALPFRQP